MATAIVTDSVADLPPHVARDLGITVVPLILGLGGESYRDGIDIDNGTFYERLATEWETLRTSSPPPGAFADAIDEAARAAQEVLVITVSGKLSACYSAALQGRELVKSRCRVDVLDSGWAAMAEGFVVREAARAARTGAGLDGATGAARAAMGKVGFLATLGSLEYLRRGGRIGAASALLGSLLNINPLISLADGVVSPVGRTRSRRAAVEQLVAFAAGYARIDALAVEDTVCGEEADLLVERLSELHPKDAILRSGMTPVIGSHTGPGLLVVSVLGDRSRERTPPVER